MSDFSKLKELLKETKLDITKANVNDDPLSLSFGDPHALGFFGDSEDGVSVPQSEQWNGEVFTDSQLSKEGVFDRIHSKVKKNKRDTY